MSKKNFSGGLSSLLGETVTRGAKTDRTKTRDKIKKGRPVTQTKIITKSSQEGTKENETRATFIVNESLLEKLKAIAYWDRAMIKDVVNASLEETVSRYEKKNGKIKPAPKK